ncbi:hypothetical protein [Candidatus Poriferisodalis sp.]|uniref:hypothetical protein n=1 Tax=Candidatus Poriferisodalis sp. TaxID=3101277 RepID=UPI003AF6AF76
MELIIWQDAEERRFRKIYKRLTWGFGIALPSNRDFFSTLPTVGSQQWLCATKLGRRVLT